MSNFVSDLIKHYGPERGVYTLVRETLGDYIDPDMPMKGKSKVTTEYALLAADRPLKRTVRFGADVIDASFLLYVDAKDLDTDIEVGDVIKEGTTRWKVVEMERSRQGGSIIFYKLYMGS